MIFPAFCQTRGQGLTLIVLCLRPARAGRHGLATAAARGAEGQAAGAARQATGGGTVQRAPWGRRGGNLRPRLQARRGGYRVEAPRAPVSVGAIESLA